MARASIPTLLPLDTYARILGIAPPHFGQAAGPTYFPLYGSCTTVWFQHDYQDTDRISRETLAQAIYDAEEDIASVLGYYPAPKWIAKEMHRYPRPHRRDWHGIGLNVRGMFKSAIASKGKFIEAGRRAVALQGTPTVVYSDPDGDGFDELATVTQATSLTDACEINTYFAGYGGAQEWEIRPALTKTITGGNFVATYDSWLFLDPDLWEVFPGVGLLADPANNSPQAINLETVGNYVTTVDVYREYTDFAQASAEFSWEPKPRNFLLNTFCTSCGGTGCIACENTIQTGCLHVRDVDRGILVPVPANYSAADAQWSEVAWTECREPDTVKLWYRAGDLDERFLRDERCDRLSDYFAHAIAWMATARLERPPCACNNTEALFRHLRQDLARLGTGKDEPSFLLDENLLANPFGTRRGEVKAWQRISQLTPQIRDYALV